jgi:hypothetical protein
MRWEQKVADRQFSEQIEDLLKTGRFADKIDKERAEAFETLIRTPGWALYIDLISTFIQARADEVLAPAGSVEGAIRLEYIKGAMSGLIMARDLPSTIIAAMKPAVPATDGDDE